jgi:hypothetical protein
MSTKASPTWSPFECRVRTKSSGRKWLQLETINSEDNVKIGTSTGSKKKRDGDMDMIEDHDDTLESGAQTDENSEILTTSNSIFHKRERQLNVTTWNRLLPRPRYEKSISRRPGVQQLLLQLPMPHRGHDVLWVDCKAPSLYNPNHAGTIPGCEV